jgi:adenosylcobinamide-phosphate synthase
MLAAACALDVALGDPHAWPHPVRAFGAAIAAADRARPADSRPARDLALGAALTAILIGCAWTVGATADRGPVLLQLPLAASTLAARSLDDAVRGVHAALAAGDLADSRRRVGWIVGRDTDALGAHEVARAALETLAESFCDGVVAPLVALRLGGCAAALAFKAVSTLDSTIGHREAPYTWFGCVAARLDDVANFVPARIAALAIVAAAAIAGENPRAAARIALAEAGSHRSPNAGWPEAALAGALGVRLGGDNRYGGVLRTGSVFNRDAREPDARDVARGLVLVRIAGALCALAACAA